MNAVTPEERLYYDVIGNEARLDSVIAAKLADDLQRRVVDPNEIANARVDELRSCVSAHDELMHPRLKHPSRNRFDVGAHRKPGLGHPADHHALRNTVTLAVHGHACPHISGDREAPVGLPFYAGRLVYLVLT